MSRTVLLFRHGKSDWNAEYGHDHDRPLNPRGKRAARAMGHWLARAGPVPDLILCSTAVRAQATCHLASEAGEWKAEIQYERGLYHAHPSDLLNFLVLVSDDIQTVMLVGHQPTWAMTAQMLSKHPVTEFPTASMARIDFPISSWGLIEPGSGSLIWHQFPKRLPPSIYDPKGG